MSIWGLIKRRHEEAHERMRLDFEAMGSRYCQQQRNYALTLIDQYGVRATARILRIPRRTLQRWCRATGKCVPRCPGWVYTWAAERRKRRESWIWGNSGQ